MSRTPLRPVKRVLLIFPPMYDAILFADTMACPPMGIASLASYIRDVVDVTLLDCLAEGYWQRQPVNNHIMKVGLQDDEILERIRSYGPDMVGISCIFSNQFACVRDLSRKIRQEIDREMVIVTGGTHPSFLPEQTLSETDVDYVVLGEGELGLKQIIEAHNSGGRIEDIDGIAFRTLDDIQVNPRTKWIQDLDTLPFPARDLLPMEIYFKIRQPMGLHWRKARNTPIVSSRGCPFGCPFCSSHLHWGSRFRKRSAENVLAEIEHLKSRYDIQELKWQDDNLTADRNRAKAIFQGMIDRGLAMPWNTPNGIALWTLDEGMLDLMKKSGCFEITLAVESGDPVSFERYVRKPFTLDKALQVARMARDRRITTVAYFIVGFPGETLEQVKTSMRFALELGCDYLAPFVFNPLPGSELWRECLEKGFISDHFHYEEANSYYVPGAVVYAESRNSDSGIIDDINYVQGMAYLRNLARLPFRNPKEFMAVYGRKIFVTPWFWVDFLRVIWSNRGILVNGIKKLGLFVRRNT